MYEVWKRKRSEIAHLWNMDGTETFGTEREKFKFHIVPDVVTKTVKKESFQKTYVRRVCVELPLVFIGWIISVLWFIGYMYYIEVHKKESSLTSGAKVINSVWMIVWHHAFEHVAHHVVNWENQRYENDWEDSFTTKMFAFSFVNHYMHLFALAFYE